MALRHESDRRREPMRSQALLGRAKPLKHERFRNPTGREVHPEARQPVAITAGPWARLSIATAPVSGAWGRRL